ncbi:MAG: hypothetical protein CVU11_07760 [Bacteroidetes bacterium HGW-Bacteroidetes-6]|nr:MAG: hypothetical protein CVU11_07760 [Bacteroidetes bacterium HGW-Bacteroidetes-6]
MVGTIFFIINIFSTIAYTPAGYQKQSAGAMLSSAVGLTGLRNLFARYKKEHLVSLPVAAIARGTVDMAFNSGVILFTGVLILVFMVASMFGHDLRRTAIDALLYKNWFWWGLDLIADGLVLIFVAGTWYLLAMLITGKDDHFIPFKLHAPLIKSLINAKSVTDIVFTKKDHASNHCSIGNIKLSLDTMINWLDAKIEEK